MKLRCECGAEVLAKNVNLAAAVATCEACGSVFSIDQSKPTSPAVAEAPMVIPLAFTPRESFGEEALPSAYRAATSSAGGARWTYRWFRWSYVFMVLFFLFWDSICSVFVVGGFSQGALGFFSLLLPHVWIGVIGSYWVFAHLFNRSTITLTAQALTVQSGPIPWPSKSIARDQIGVFDVEKGWRNSNQQQFQVRVIDKDKRPKRVLSALSEEEASYLKNELNLELQKQG